MEGKWWHRVLTGEGEAILLLKVFLGNFDILKEIMEKT